jgi:CheY-like chemotaxis protein
MSAGEVPVTPGVVVEPARERRVLVVDDEETSRYVLRQMLNGQTGLRVVEAETGADALRLARLAKPDAILLDLRLPDVHGSEVMKRLREDPATRKIPVIVCTSSVIGGSDRALLAGAAAILSKATLTRDIMTERLQAVWHKAPSDQDRGGAG